MVRLGRAVLASIRNGPSNTGCFTVGIGNERFPGSICRVSLTAPLTRWKNIELGVNEPIRSIAVMAVPRAYDHQQLRQRMGNLEQQQQQTLSEPSQASTNSLQESSVMESFSSDPTNAPQNPGKYFIY